MSASSRGKASGGAALNILLFLGGAVFIIGLVVWYQKSSQHMLPSSRFPGDFENDAVATAPLNDQRYLDRGLQPNRAGTTTAANTTTPPAAPRFIGETDFRTYHRPDCKTLKFVEERARVPLSTPEDAFARGFIPCKICKPDAPGQNVTNPVKTETPKKTDTARKPPVRKAPDQPVSLPIKDVTLSFPFTVKSRDVVNEGGALRVEFEVDVQRPLLKDDVLLLAQKLVAQETAKGPINAVNVLIHTDPKGGAMIKWICMVDWAPWGILSRANEVKAGDYKNHSFNIYDQGFYNPRGK